MTFSSKKSANNRDILEVKFRAQFWDILEVKFRDIILYIMFLTIELSNINI